MRPKLILIGGEAWTGKSTCAEILYRQLNNSAWLDGDEETLTQRARQRDAQASPRFLLLEETRSLTNTVKIDTVAKKPAAVVDEMLAVIHPRK